MLNHKKGFSEPCLHKMVAFYHCKKPDAGTREASVGSLASPIHLPTAEASVGFTAPTPTHLPTGAAEVSLGTMRRLASPSPLVSCSHPPLLTCIEIFWLVSRLHG